MKLTMRFVHVFTLSVILGFTAAACSVCDDGTSVSCTCEGNGHSGAKVCAGGEYGKCLCPSPTFEDSGADLASSDLASNS